MSGGQHSSAGKSATYTYSADGGLLLQRDTTTANSTVTLYLGREQLTLTTSTGGVTGLRYYPTPGGPTEIRSSTGTLTYECGNSQNTNTVTINAGATQTETRRSFTPYGGTRGTAPASWVDNRGFLNQPTDANSGLDLLGARNYDPTTGRFLQIDPLFEGTDALQLGGYTYARNSPVSHADPTGTRTCSGAADCEGDPTHGNVGGGNPPPPPGDDHCAKGKHAGHGCGSGPKSQPFSVPFTPTTGQLVAADPEYVTGNVPWFVAAGEVFAGWCGTQLAEHGAAVAGECNHLQDEFHWNTTGWKKALLTSVLVTAAAVAAPICVMGGCVTVGMFCTLNPVDCNELVESAATGKPVAGAAVPEEALLDGIEDISTGDTVNALTGLLCSFDPHTPVLLADGTTKSIDHVKIGDLVKATDPVHGVTLNEPVTQLHSNLDTDLTDLTISANHQNAILHTTTNHPFWDSTTHQWTPAGKLHPGDMLETGNKTIAVVRDVYSWIAPKTMLNLSINELHTYYVMAGNTAILVHNVCGHTMQATLVGADGQIVGTEQYTSGGMTALQRALGFPKSMLATHTEAKATTEIAFQEGDTLYLQGELAPCKSCKGFMNNAAEYYGIEIVYTWDDKIWTATR